MVSKKDVKIIKVAFIGAIVSLGGWYIFNGIEKLIPLEGQSPFAYIGLGLLISWTIVKLGIK